MCCELFCIIVKVTADNFRESQIRGADETLNCNWHFNIDYQIIQIWMIYLSNFDFDLESWIQNLLIQVIYCNILCFLWFRSLRANIFTDVDSEEETRLRITPFSSPRNSTTPSKKELTGLNSPIAIFLMILWYMFSAFNLFMNKYVISYLNGEPALLGML